MKTSDRARRRSRISTAAGCLRSSVTLSFERFSQTKLLESPLTAASKWRAKSPVPRRSILITRAPRSASWRVANGAATACSRARMVMPARGCIRSYSVAQGWRRQVRCQLQIATTASAEAAITDRLQAGFKLVRPWESQNMLGDVGKDEVRRDGGNLIKAGLAELALDIVLGREAIAAEGLDRGVGGFPGGFGGKMLGHVGFGTAGLSAVEALGSVVAHQIGGADVRVRLGDREGDALVLTDWPAKDNALAGVFGGAIDEPVAVADALGGQQDALGIHAVEDIAEAIPFLADQIRGRDGDIVEVDLVRLVVHEGADRLDRQAVAASVGEIDQEYG